MSSVPPRAPDSWGAEEWDLLGDLTPLGGLPPLEAIPTEAPPPDPAAVAAAMAAAIEDLVADLNPPQREAVLHDGGPLVVVAGAGSGKTRVLTRRIARLVASGVPPWRILAITFTNKAADEMRRRVVELVGSEAERMWISTFHAACVRMLRRNVERIGYRPGFTIYDDGDSRRLVEHVLDDLGVDQRRFPPRAVLGVISSAKSDLIGVSALQERAGTIYEERIAQAYAEYERRLVAANAMDFDDLLVRTVRMFRDHPDVLEQYSDRFEHVLVDEYQDTNVAQNELVILLGQARRNVCVVGDTDQSIYRFRGAEMRNLLEFERAFPDSPRHHPRPELPVHPDDPRRRQLGHLEQPPPSGEGPLERSRQGRAHPALQSRRRPGRGVVRHGRDRDPEPRRGRRLQRHRRLLPDQRPEPRPRDCAGRSGDRLHGGGGDPFLRPARDS